MSKHPNEGSSNPPITTLPPGVKQIDATRELARKSEDATNEIIDRQTRRLSSEK